MKTVIFATGNAQKFATARDACRPLGIDLVQKDIDTPEIQSEDPEAVATDKAQKAFQIAGAPVVITDDSWSFAGLNGFPGVYMHSMNHWFTPEDFLRLTLPLKDRRVTLTQTLVYCDGKSTKLFKLETGGSLLKEVRGESPYPSHTITALDTDGGLSIAEAFDQATDKSSRPTAKVWQDFAEWFAAN